jgi:hypothetical protein
MAEPWTNWFVRYDRDLGDRIGVVQLGVAVMGTNEQHAMKEVERLLMLPAGSAKSAVPLDEEPEGE